MAVTYGFYNSLNKDRMYNAQQMSAIFDGIITDGVFGAIGDKLMPVAGTGMQVIVKTGKCWFNSTWTLNDAQLPLDVEAADVSLTRIDAVVVEINSAVGTRANSIKVIKGTPSANPAKPALSATETLHQYALGYITVAAGVTAITAANIEVNVGKTTCPFITSVLQQTDITDLFNQWDAEFNAWFANVQSQLSGNVAANLQRQIDENWANTLKDATKTKLGLASSAIPDDAFSKLAPKVGDLYTTIRTDVASDFALTDGSIIPNRVEYSEIIGLVDPNMTNVYKNIQTIARNFDLDITQPQKIATDGAVYAFAAGRRNPQDTSSWETWIVYSTDLSTWSAINLGDQATLYANNQPSLAYSPKLRRWVVFIGDRRGSGSRRLYAMYSNSILGEWTKVQITEARNAMNTLYFFGWVGNYFVALESWYDWTNMYISPDGVSWSEIELKKEYISANSSYTRWSSPDIEYIDGRYYSLSELELEKNVYSIWCMYSNPDDLATINHIQLTNLESLLGDLSNVAWKWKILKYNSAYYLFGNTGIYKTESALETNPVFTKISDIAFDKECPLVMIEVNSKLIVYDSAIVAQGTSLENLVQVHNMADVAIGAFTLDGKPKLVGASTKEKTDTIEFHVTGLGFALPVIQLGDVTPYIKIK